MDPPSVRLRGHTPVTGARLFECSMYLVADELMQIGHYYSINQSTTVGNCGTKRGA
jgi:hypothetical protein